MPCGQSRMASVFLTISKLQIYLITFVTKDIIKEMKNYC